MDGSWRSNYKNGMKPVTKAEIILDWFKNLSEREHLKLKSKHGHHLNSIELYIKEFGT